MQGNAAGIRWETQDRTLILTIDRQHRRNALDPDAHHQLASLFDIFSDSDEPVSYTHLTLPTIITV